MTLLVRAPSNIALVKYMGKNDASVNLPANPSLSMTLDGLATWVSAEPTGSGFKLVAEVPHGAPSQTRAPKLSAQGSDKFLRHAARVRAEAERILPEHGLKYVGARDLLFRTGNTFPEASGIASSASSFAALTLAVAAACAADPQAFARQLDADPSLRRQLARISRQGSGSSCRSFEGHWVLWEKEDARTVPAPAMPELAHFVLLISSEAKGVSSSEAHARVKSSPLWSGRVERVGRRLAELQSALTRADLPELARLVWSEAWEMHSLFHTSGVPFTYWKPGSVEALQWLMPFVAGAAQGAPATAPIVTMDAGPNVHIIVPRADASRWRELLSERFGRDALLEDRPGRGAEIVQLGASS